MALHPFFVSMLEQAAGRTPLADGTPADARATLAASRQAVGSGPAMAEVRDIRIPTRAGGADARLYQPSAEPIGQIVYLHGGGWVVGTLDDYDALARTLARLSGCAVLLVDYRLAPEHPFPAGLEDSEDAVRWAAGQRSGPAGRRLPLIVAGDSAGANLAAAVVSRLEGSLAVALQLLYYPVTDCDFDRPSYVEHGQGLMVSRRDMEWFFAHYAPRALWVDPAISPIRGDRLERLPPTVLVTAEYDVLHDEGRDYAEKLRRKGVRVTERRLDGAVHGFLRLHDLFPPAMTELERAAADIRSACAGATAS